MPIAIRSIAALLALSSLPAFGAATPRAEPLKVGIYDNRPMVFLNEHGEPAGLQVDIFNEIAEREQWTVEYVYGSWQECLRRLESAEIDLLLDIGYSNERAELYDFTEEPIFSTWAQVYMHPSGNLRSIPDLQGKQIAVMRGDIHYASLKRLLRDFGIDVIYQEYDDYKDLMQAVEHRRADAGLFSRIAGLQLEGFYGVRRSPIVLDPIQVRIAFPKGKNADVREAIDTHLRRMKRDPNSVYNLGIDHWLGSVQQPEPQWWVPWMMGGGALLGGSALGITGLLRAQVRRKTAELTAKNIELEREIQSRARIESIVQASRDRMSIQNRVLMNLARSEAIGRGDLEIALRQITAAAANTLDVERASVWVLEENDTRVHCICLYQAPLNEYSQGKMLHRSDYPAYFEALRENRIIAASDAHHDPRTAEFSHTYLDAHGITSMLDAPVRSGQRVVALLCNEHVGPKREWTLEEESFAASLADFVALALEARERTLAEMHLRQSEERNRLILEKALDAVIISDEKGIVQGWNARAEQTFGYSREEALGQPVIKLIVPQELHGDVIQQFLEFRRTESGTTRRDALAKRKSGEEFYAEFSVSVARQGNERIYTAFVRDLTEQKRAREMRERLTQIETELELARSIQRSFLPQQFPPFPERKEFEVYAEMIPATDVGGDFYDFYLLDHDRLAFAIGDVSGKGVPGALVMAVTLTLLKASARSSSSVTECLQRLNRLLCEENEGTFFVTMVYGVLHIPTGTLTYGCAGHPSPLLVSRDHSVSALPSAGGLILGVYPDAYYSECSYQLQPDDAVVLYTDGVTEAMNPDHELYAESRLFNVLQRSDGQTLDGLTRLIIEDVKDFAETSNGHDDLTLLTLKYTGQKQQDPVEDSAIGA